LIFWFIGYGEKTFFFDGNKTIIDYQSNLFLKTPNFASGTHDLTFLIEHQNQGGENTDGEDPEGNELVRRPKHIASATFNYAFLPNAEGRDRANLNLDIRYNGEQQDNIYLAPFFERQRTTLDRAIRWLPSPEVMSSIRVLSYSPRIENLLDEQYEEVFNYRAPGIGAYGGVRWSY